MPDRMRHYESLLFNYETTYRNDYRYGEITPLVKTTHRVKKPRIRPKYVPLKDLHALTAWKDPNMPLNLYHKPEPILQTNPHITQKRYEKPPDVNRAEVQKTRPKVVMTPAVDLDDVEEPKRQLLINQIYVSEGEKALREAVDREQFDVKAPLSEVYAPSNPVAIERLLQPYVSPEWRMDSLSWDKRQMRTYTTPTKVFWLSRPLSHCRACRETEIFQANKLLHSQMKTGNP